MGVRGLDESLQGFLVDLKSNGDLSGSVDISAAPTDQGVSAFFERNQLNVPSQLLGVRPIEHGLVCKIH